MPDTVSASWAQKLAWWAADYLYAGRRQVAILQPPWTFGRRRRTPAAWRAGRDDLPEVVLVPGVYEHWTFLRPLGDALAAAGHRVRVVHGLGVNRRPIPATAQYLGTQLAALPVPEAGRVLVAHSKGGLVGKNLLIDSGAATEDDDTDAASRPLGLLGLVTVCTPFHGVRLASLFADPSIRAFRPQDETIVWLANETSVNARIVSVFGAFDPHIPEGSALDGATNVLVPTSGHFRVLGAASTHQSVIEGVESLTHR
ncbi:triacylglycerol lipase [Microbacterium sp. C7(2022)]|uniref:esterase/lipase family protein n=1 Tax=Microbacterium sp. C7(2022) TaxID=2992759 RepID=UPI00237A8A83|nr:hypothetical protein [Microbacterium sp. C7(2022)]MDE0546213.1 hypothetical protein [Microbacterium sp. C7(2022)]